MPIRYVIQNIRISGKIIKQSGIACMGNDPVLEATWTCIRLD